MRRELDRVACACVYPRQSTAADRLARDLLRRRAAAVALAATAGRYGYHRDELYFRMLRPAWGYVDQPPLTPLIARVSAALFGDSVVSMRIPAIVAVAAAIVLIAITTRELGGGRAAQALSAWAYGFAVFPMVTGHVLLTATVDLVLWTAVLLAVTRALLRDDPRWWRVAGALVGVSLYNKLLITMLLLGLAAGLLVIGPWSPPSRSTPPSRS